LRSRQGAYWALFGPQEQEPVKTGGQGRTTAEAGVIWRKTIADWHRRSFCPNVAFVPR